MGGKQSTSSSGRPSQPGAGDSRAAAGPLASLLSPVSTSSGDPRLRARSLSSVLSIPAPSQSPESPVESGSSTPDGTPFGRVFAAHSLPVHLVSFNGIKCPVCSKFVLPDDVECHLVMCLTKPRISYNGGYGGLTLGPQVARTACVWDVVCGTDVSRAKDHMFGVGSKAYESHLWTGRTSWRFDDAAPPRLQKSNSRSL
ncbi:unnamed protein product [Ixodes pacificus]